jgi:hypothetical protein
MGMVTDAGTEREASRSSSSGPATTPGVAHRILMHAASLPEGGIVRASALCRVLYPDELHRPVESECRALNRIHKALSRLVRNGKLIRIRPGAYVAPVMGPFGTRAPAPERVVRSWAIEHG